MKEFILILVSSVLVNNYVLSQTLGICPFLGVSKKLNQAVGMGMAVTFVMVIATAVTWPIQNFILSSFDLGYLQTIVFILIIASLVQILEIILKRFSPALHQGLGVYLPLITTNCAVLGVAILMTQKDFDLLTGVIYSIATALGFALALVLFAGIRERLDVEDVPQALKGVPIALITASLLAMAFMGFANVVPLP